MFLLLNEMNTVCDIDKCVGCFACLSLCPVNAIKYEEDYYSCNAIKTDRCIRCNKCLNVCQQINPPILRKPLSYYQGWNNNKKQRNLSTSGGIASAISVSFIKNGGKVVLC